MRFEAKRFGLMSYRMNVRRMDSHGGWLATPTDLVRFLVRVDGFPTKPDILKPDTLQTMTTASAASPGYAKGWCVNQYHNWCWATLTNTGNRDTKSPIGADLDALIWQMVGKITRWPDRDMF